MRGGSGAEGQLLHFLLEASLPRPRMASPIMLVSPTLQGAEGTGSGQGAPSASSESPCLGRCPEQDQGVLDEWVMGDHPLSD